MKKYRQWLGPHELRDDGVARRQLLSDNIEDYYLTPFDLGYGQFVKFDHDFVGRAGVEAMAAHPKRTKVTLVWNGDDVARALGTLFHDGGDIAKYIDLPLANYATLPYDKVLKGGKTVGLSTYTGYTVQRARDGLAGDGGQRSRRAGHRSDDRLGRTGPRLDEADGRTAQADRTAGHRRAGADLGSRARGVQTEVIAVLDPSDVADAIDGQSRRHEEHEDLSS